VKRIKKFLKKDGELSYFDFNGCKLPDVSTSDEKMETLIEMFEEAFLIPCYHNDDYTAHAFLAPIYG
jgi:hypothetical protein